MLNSLSFVIWNENLHMSSKIIVIAISPKLVKETLTFPFKSTSSPNQSKIFGISRLCYLCKSLYARRQWEREPNYIKYDIYYCNDNLWSALTNSLACR